MRVELRGQQVTFVSNPARSLGLSTSVIHGLRAARYSGATLFLPMDFAELSGRDVARLIKRWHSAKRRVTATRLGDRPATPLILPRGLYSELAAL